MIVKSLTKSSASALGDVYGSGFGYSYDGSEEAQ
jgi:hypothetical protein